MDFKPDPLEYLSVFKKALLKKESSVEDEKQIVLKLRMFTGAIYEVLYSGRFTFVIFSGMKYNMTTLKKGGNG